MRKISNSRLAGFVRQLISETEKTRRQCINRAETFANSLDDTDRHSLGDVLTKVSGHQQDAGEAASVKLSADELRTDLQAMILNLCDSFRYRDEMIPEEFFDTRDLADKFNVSTKTIHRWRKDGLMARRVLFPNGKRRIVFTAGAVESFKRRQADRIEKSSGFSQLTDEERRDVVRRATRMARWCKCSLNEVSSRIARKMGRSVETIRYTIRKHADNEEVRRLFTVRRDSVGDSVRRAMFRDYSHGMALEDIARRHKLSLKAASKTLQAIRADKVIAMDLDYMFSPEFDEAGRDAEMAGPMPPAKEKKKLTPAPKDLPAYLASLYKSPLLEPEQERHLFRKFNYLKYKADMLREKLNPSRPSQAQLDRIEALLEQAATVKNRLIRANLRLVVSIARKHIGRGAQDLFELISDGNLSLMRAVEKFDYSRGYKFSTYASWAIMKNFARSVPRERYRQGRFQTGQDEILDVVAGMAEYEPDEHRLPEIRESLNNVLKKMSPRERDILSGHFGLSERKDSYTLEQLGKKLGISKERVRQIEINALGKMREMLSEERVLLMQ